MALGGRPKEEGGHERAKFSLDVETLRIIEKFAKRYKFKSKVVEEATSLLSKMRDSSIPLDKLLEKMSSRVMQAVYRTDVGLTLSEGEPIVAEDMSNVTIQEIIDKIKDFIDSDPIDENYNIFLHYLANYPVSMCKRQVSPTLKFLIGFHYHFGQMIKEEYESYEKVNPVSVQELAQIFGRSKATVHDCIKDTEEAWKHFLVKRLILR